MAKRYRQLSQSERDRLSLFSGEGKSLREIARLLRRDPSTISRELKRNSLPIGPCSYLPNRAQRQADTRKSKARRRVRLKEPRLRAYVRRQLGLGWSPERIAGRWKLLGLGQISHEAIYQWIYKDGREFVRFLARSHRLRHCRRNKQRWTGLRIPSRTPLALRPRSAEDRRQAGHWEADTMIGKKHGSALQILVERKTRFARLNKLQDKGASNMSRVLVRSLVRLPKALRRTITYDNGRENVQHVQTNKELGTKSFFCAPMHSWEKGSVENLAGLVRRRLPKDTNFAIVPNAQIKQTERWLNGLPRKCLGYKTAAEAFRQAVALTC